MQRRKALSYLGIWMSGTVALPAWAGGWGWTPASLPRTEPLFTPEEQAILVELVETIIPVTDTPGAKALQVDAFVVTMLRDCYDTPTQRIFREGLGLLERSAKQQYNTSFMGLTALQRFTLLTSFDIPGKAKKSFFPLLKTLTIQGYTTSEYVMTHILPYELVPGRFVGSYKLPH